VEEFTHGAANLGDGFPQVPAAETGVVGEIGDEGGGKQEGSTCNGLVVDRKRLDAQVDSLSDELEYMAGAKEDRELTAESATLVVWFRVSVEEGDDMFFDDILFVDAVGSGGGGAHVEMEGVVAVEDVFGDVDGDQGVLEAGQVEIERYAKSSGGTTSGQDTFELSTGGVVGKE
jgi:hypothetical protein